MVLGRARLHRLRKNSMLLAILGGAALQCVRENSFLGNPVERNARKSSPGGATELSPALQRWEKWKERFKSRRDDRVLAHTLQRCENCIVLNAAAAEGTGRSFPRTGSGDLHHPCALLPFGVSATSAGQTGDFVPVYWRGTGKGAHRVALLLLRLLLGVGQLLVGDIGEGSALQDPRCGVAHG